jgi:single-stranded-DNA-specific exonuclease
VKKDLSLAGKKWRFRGERKAEETLYEFLCRVREYSPDFLQKGEITNLAEPEELLDMQKAGDRILNAKENKENILLFGDFDLDGASGAATLYFALKAVGIPCRIKLPSRSDGYGLSKKAYDEAKQKNVSLLITVDCGSSNAEAIQYGNDLGIDTIVTDHHTLSSVLPPAHSVVHPHRGSPSDQTWNLTGAGVAFFLGVHLLRRQYSESEILPLLSQLAELAVLGTVADVGRLVGQNRLITQIGLEHMKSSQHPGLRALLESAKITPDSLTAESIAFFLAPRLNAAGRMAHPNVALRLLLGDKTAATELEELNLQRKDITSRLCETAENCIADSGAPFFLLFHEDFFAGVGGLIAARMSEKYSRPVAVLSRSDDPQVLTASCRGPEDFHFANALKECSHLLIGHGGHAAAAGFSIRESDAEDFQEHFSTLVARERGSIVPISELIADGVATGNDFLRMIFVGYSMPSPLVRGIRRRFFAWKILFLRRSES